MQSCPPIAAGATVRAPPQYFPSTSENHHVGCHKLSEGISCYSALVSVGRAARGEESVELRARGKGLAG
ncbi:hypothetical protein PsYK624_149880 [Phanerochaete sordida]|uniref:Uncharacterized protein n=1 Tax=Phanerochaete sordida TaxID=48140 RepID=A0A9P3GNP1_9APHY|nr:hypothetical protein PsYK624_149880 [Phanerochaete sordida]